MFVNLRVIDDFYPRSPCGERQLAARDSSIMFVFLSTLSLRRATRLQPWGPGLSGISIHALLAESDGGFGAGSWRLAIFLSTLSLRRATLSMCSWLCGLLFLSTLSLRRATVASVLEAGGSRYFYPRSPCGERRYRCVLGCVGYYFYPRSPCGERRLLNSSWISSIKFLSTLSLRRATGAPVDKMPSSSDFYPRSPCGERPVYTSLSGGRNTFLSTLSLRRATMVSLLICNANFDFYPRSPCGERLTTSPA